MRLTHFWAIVLTVLLSKCNQASQNTPPAATGFTSSTTALQANVPAWATYITSNIKVDSTVFTRPQRLARLTDKTLFEASGLAPSHQNWGCLWAEEDSGNSNQIQLINQDGTVLARFTLDGIENNDWEDIVIGPGPIPGKTYIYVAEIGDNRYRYPQKIIYRFPEPAVDEQLFPFEGHIANIDIIRLTLPDGAQNSEAILVDTDTKDLFIFSKGNSSTVYRAAFPQSLTRVTLMASELVLPFKDVTSASVSPKGNELLVRTYEQIYYYKRLVGESIIDAFKRPPLLIPMAYEAQGEAIGWAFDGSGFYTTSEKTRSTTQSILFYKRAK